jgi:hypothetical protein
LNEKASVASWKQRPTSYKGLRAGQRHLARAERFGAKRMNAQTISVNGPHGAFIALPGVVSNLIVGAASAVD